MIVPTILVNLKANGVLELIVNKNDAEVILLKEHMRDGKCAFGINLIKEGLLLDNVDGNELLNPLRMEHVSQAKRVLGDTISATRINKAQGPITVIEEVEKPKKRGCTIF